MKLSEFLANAEIVRAYSYSSLTWGNYVAIAVASEPNVEPDKYAMGVVTYELDNQYDDEQVEKNAIGVAINNARKALADSGILGTTRPSIRRWYMQKQMFIKVMSKYPNLMDMMFADTEIEHAKEEKTGKVRLEKGDFGTYLLVNVDTGEDILVQTDYDFPGTASTFGWSPLNAGPCVDSSEHDGTDGTVSCDKCGLTASDFIESAREFLDDHIGEEAEDPGYFDDSDDNLNENTIVEAKKKDKKRYKVMHNDEAREKTPSWFIWDDLLDNVVDEFISEDRAKEVCEKLNAAFTPVIKESIDFSLLTEAGTHEEAMAKLAKAVMQIFSEKESDFDRAGADTSYKVSMIVDSLYSSTDPLMKQVQAKFKKEQFADFVNKILVKNGKVGSGEFAGYSTVLETKKEE